jgi:hypothetical protein
MRAVGPQRIPIRYTARISVPDGVVVMPADGPYEWQMLCEHVVAAARQRGAVRVRVGASECVVHRDDAAQHRCSRCTRLLRTTFRTAWQALCPDCARDWLAADPAERTTRRAISRG